MSRKSIKDKSPVKSSPLPASVNIETQVNQSRRFILSVMQQELQMLQTLANEAQKAGDVLTQAAMIREVGKLKASVQGEAEVVTTRILRAAGVQFTSPPADDLPSQETAPPAPLDTEQEARAAAELAEERARLLGRQP